MARPEPRAPAILLWCGVILLSAIGVAAAISRGVFLEDFGTRADPLRERFLDVLGLSDPHASQRPEDLRRFDSRFADHPILTVLHILPGGIILVLAPLQFSSRIRSRHIRFHRWSGRFLVAAGLVAGVSALFFGLRVPFGGFGERSATAVFGGLFLFAVVRAFVAIRRHDVECHREWMIRAFAIAAGTATVRLVGPVWDIALTPAGYRAPAIFALSLWSGWGFTAAVAELWIRHTRRQGHEWRLAE